MLILKLLKKMLLLPVLLIIGIIRLLVKAGINLSSFFLGALMLIVFCCIIYTIIQHTWSSMMILIIMEIFLILITAGTGLIEGLLETVSDSIARFIRS